MSTLKTNNIQHVDRSDPSIIINTDGSVNIAGTMTYEDVTNVDAVGIITGRSLINAQKQVHVGTGVSVKAGGLNVTAGITTVQALQATAGTFSGDVTFTGASYNMTWDKSDNSLIVNDDARIKFGTGKDLHIYHNQSNSVIREEGTGNLNLQTTGGNVEVLTNTTETSAKFISDGAVELYHDNTKRLETTSTGVSFLDGNITNVGSIALDSVKGDADDNTNITFATNDVITFKCGSTSPALTVNTTQVKVEDNQKFVAGTGNDLQIYSNGAAGYIDHVTTGTGADLILRSKTFVVRNLSDETMIVGNQNGAVNLYHNDTIRFSTTGNGADVFGSGASNNYFKLINTSGTSNASHHMTIDTYNASGYWSDLKIDASNIQLNTYTGNRATLSNTALTFASGVNIAMANGNGINFSATGGGSNTSNESELFNDYEEGTVNILIHDAVGSNISVETNTYKYTKIGNKVYIEGSFVFAETGSKNGGLMVLYNLPFVPTQNGQANGTYWYDGTSDAADVTGVVYVHTGSVAYLKQATTIGQPSNNKYLTFNEIQKNNTRPLYTSFSYITNS